MRADFAALEQAARGQHWTDDTTVPPTFFGPLWPEGPPPEWPVEVEQAEERSPASAPVPAPACERILPTTREQSLFDRAQLLAPVFAPGDRVPHAEMWELVEKLGKGGFGQVWLARKSGTQDQRAVKFCFHPTARDRLTDVARHESKVVQHVQKHMSQPGGGHPNVVSLLECNLAGATPWLMYEYVPGGRTLANVIEELQTLTPAERVARSLPLLRTIAGAVGQFHHLNVPIVHRDLTPRNVLMADGGIPRITDFGIGGAATTAALEDAIGLTEFTVRVPTLLRSAGTPPHASPQQRAGAEPDPRDDVYALGVMTYQMLTGELNAPGADARDKLEELAVPEGLIKLIVKSVSDPARRPKDAVEWANALAPLLPSESGTPVARTSWKVTMTVPSLWYSRPVADPNAEWERLRLDSNVIEFSSEYEYRLDLHDQVTDQDLEGFRAMAGVPLSVLSMSGCRGVSDGGLEHLKDLTNLQYLNLSYCDKLTDGGLERLGALTNLQYLYLTNCRNLTDGGLEHLGALTNLQHLRLMGCSKLTNAGLEHLGALTNLQHLNLSYSGRLTDASLERLGVLTNLRHLDLTYCYNLTGVGLERLGALTNLQHLNLSNCPKLADESIAALKIALPRCEIKR
jgi:serine/threonine protein kinase